MVLENDIFICNNLISCRITNCELVEIKRSVPYIFLSLISENFSTVLYRCFDCYCWCVKRLFRVSLNWIFSISLFQRPKTASIRPATMIFGPLFEMLQNSSLKAPFLTANCFLPTQITTLTAIDIQKKKEQLWKISTMHHNIMAAATSEDSCDFGSNTYFALCGLGGIISCGLTHTMVVPLDLVKCRLQVDPAKYKTVYTGFRITLAEDGIRGLSKGWAPTFFGYSMQGLCKFGLYEVFKVMYSDIIGEENSYLYRTSLYLAASASAEFFADIALAPMEAAKVKIQTTPGFANTLRKAVPKMLAQEGLSAFYKGLVPLWMRQIPYTMMKFACFERTLELLYKYVVPKPRQDCSKSEQLVVTFAAGYIAGIFCAIVSHPADTVVSKLNQAKGASSFDVARKLGWAGLWGGLLPRIVMIGTLTAAQWFIYDAVKVYLRMPRPPPPEMPKSLQNKRNCLTVATK